MDKQMEDFTDEDWHEWRQFRQEIIDSELGLNGETLGNEKYRESCRNYSSLKRQSERFMQMTAFAAMIFQQPTNRKNDD